jgi:DNA-binding winged helix-turn-helix (wHTH) protein/Flp pilus assembly protein TadD
MKAPPPTIYEFGSFRLDLTERLLQRNGRPVSLTPKAFEVLTLLIERRGHLVEKDELMREVWSDAFVEEANLSRTIWMLRQALGDDRNGQGIIQTVPKHGYRFVAEVEEVSGDRGPSKVRVNSMALMPLEDFSGFSAHEYLADGVTEGLIASLSRAKGLRVIAAKAVAAYKNSSQMPSEIARLLNVDAILLGSFARDGERLRVNLRLIFAATEEEFWSEDFAGNWSGILYLQRDIAGAVAEQLDVQMPLVSHEARQVNPEAYDLYLRARFYLLKEAVEETNEAIALLEQVVKLDPEFAQAFAELARAYSLNSYFFAPKNEEKWAEKVFISLERSNELNPYLPEAHLSRGWFLWYKNGFRHDQAIAEYRRALELNPNFDEARHQLGIVYHHVGLFDQALAEYHLALAINPAKNLIRAHLAGALNFQLKNDEALGILNSLLPDLTLVVNYQKIWALCHLGRYDEAEEVAEFAHRSNPIDEGGLITGGQAVIAAHLGNGTKAEQKIRRAIEIGDNYGHFHHSAYNFAEAYAILNKPELAMKWLQLAADDGFPCYPLFANDPDLDNIRNYPGFKDFMSKQKKQWELRMKSY